MCIWESFTEGFRLFKRNFLTLITLCFSRLAVALAVGLVGLILLLPSLAGGLSQIFANPALLSESPYALQYASYFFFYVLLMIGIVVMLAPFLAFPHTAGAVLSTKKKKIDFKSSIELIKVNYQKLLVDGLIYALILCYLFLQSLFLFMSYPALGFVLFLVSIFISVKLAFWDILALSGDKHPLKGSWELTGGRFWTALGFVVLANILMQIVSLLPIIGVLLGIVLIPYITTSKAVFVSKLSKKKKPKVRA